MLRRVHLDVELFLQRLQLVLQRVDFAEQLVAVVAPPSDLLIAFGELMLQVVDVILLFAIDAVLDAQAAGELALLLAGVDELAVEHLVGGGLDQGEEPLESFFVQFGVGNVVKAEFAERAAFGERANGCAEAFIGVERFHIVDHAVERPVHVPDVQLVHGAFVFKECLEGKERADEIEGVGVFLRHDVLARAFAMEDEGVRNECDALRAHDRGRREHEILGQNDVFLEAKAVRLHEIGAEELVPREVLHRPKRPVGVVFPAKRLAGELVGEHGPVGEEGRADALIEHAVGEDHHIGVCFLGARDGSFDERGLAPVVRVEEVEVLAASRVDASIAGGAGAGVFLPDELDTAVGLFIFLENRGSAVGGAVVNADDFDALVRLLEQAVEALLEESLAVVYRDDDGNEALLLAMLGHGCS